MLHLAIGCSREAALDEIPESIGWQMIHAHLSSEGCARRWMNASFGEPDTDLTNWRESVNAADAADDIDY